MRRFILLSIVTFACITGERAEALELFGWLPNRPATDSIYQLPTSATQSWYDASDTYAGEVIFDEHGEAGYDACCDECGDCCCGAELRCHCRRILAQARRCCRRLTRCCRPEPTCCEPEPACCEPVDCCPKRCLLFRRLRFRPDCCPYCADTDGEVAFESWSEGQAVEVFTPSTDEGLAPPWSPADRAPTPPMDISI